MQQLRNGDNGNGAWWQRRQRPDEQPPPRGMLPHYGRASVHLELSSLGYKYGAAPHCSRDGFTYARPLPTLNMRDLDRAPVNVTKLNNLLYLVGRSLLNSPGGRANQRLRRQ